MKDTNSWQGVSTAQLLALPGPGFRLNVEDCEGMYVLEFEEDGSLVSMTLTLPECPMQGPSSPLIRRVFSSVAGITIPGEPIG